MVSIWRRLFSSGVTEPGAVPDAGATIAEADLAAALIDEDRGWRALVSGGMRELTWAQTADNLNTAVAAYRENPLAFRLVQLQVEHVLGDGLSLRSADPKIQAELDLWWNHPLNAWPVRQFEFLTALTMDGELFVSRHVNPYDGTSYVRLVPAALIDQIETNPDDLLDERRFHQVAQSLAPDGPGRDPARAPLEGRWWDATEMRHFAINRPAGGVRGQSDLTPLMPWLRRYRDWLTDRVRLNKYRTAFVWQVQIKGAQRAEILRRQAELAVPPNPGSVIVSNENETWNAVKPDIQADQVEADGLALRLMIAAGAGVPLFWLSEAEHTARGTASEMAEPTYRHFRARQIFFGWLVRTLAVDALHARGFADVGLGDVDVDFPELEAETSLLVGQTAAQLGRTLALAVQQGWLSNADAAQVYQHFLGEAVDLPSPKVFGKEG